MQTEQKDLLNTQLNTDNNPNSESGNKPLFKTKQIQGTPFKILHKEDQYYLIMGNHLLTVGMEKEEHVIKYMVENQWNLTITCIALIVDQMKKMMNEDIQQHADNTSLSNNK